MGGPQWRRGNRDQSGDQQRQSDQAASPSSNRLRGLKPCAPPASARPRATLLDIYQPPKQCHENDRHSQNVQHIHFQQVRPWRFGITKHEFLHSQKKSEPEDFRAAQKRSLKNLRSGFILLPQTFSDQRKGDAGEEQKYRSRQRRQLLRPAIQQRFSRFRIQPGVITVRLNHQHAR